MQKQQLALKSLKILLCFQSWSNFPAKSLWPEVRTAVSMPFVDLIQDRILCIIEKMGIVVEAEGASSRLWFVSWVKEKLRHKAPLLLSILCSACCELSANVSAQAFIGFDWFCSIVSICFGFVWHGLIYCCCFATHSHLCCAHEEVLAERWEPQNMLWEPLGVRS